MDLLLADYGSDNEEEIGKQMIQSLSSAPQPLVLLNKHNTSIVIPEPELGPSNPFRGSQSRLSQTESKVQEAFVEDFFFNQSYHGFLSHDQDLPRNKKVADGKEKKRKYYDELASHQSTDEGPWMHIDDSQKQTLPVKELKATLTIPDDIGEDDINIPSNIHIVEPDREAEKWEKVNERKQSYVLPPRPARGDIANEARTIFHGTEEKDYQGRSWASIPSDLRHVDEEHEAFIPKKCIKKFIGHSKGVQVIELFPKYGHLLLSASMDGTCKIWNTRNDQNVIRTYSGHSEGVRSVQMSNDGSEFLSSGFDRYVRLWDLETGQAKGTFSNRKMNYQVKFYPNDNNIFLCAASDNRIYQWDCRTGGICQEYNYHLQACNTITFIDEGRKFISTSDDKKVLVWEYDIPVPIKYIAEPEMHSIPSITIHPSGKFLCGQSMDNTIVTYSCGDKINQLKKKLFRGHNNTGFACQIGFSPNGQFVVSGDGKGKLHFWDWKTTKEYRKLQAHDNGPCICAVWHPIVPSHVYTCGWDGLIKLWS